jgi:hypothetical protein
MNTVKFWLEPALGGADIRWDMLLLWAFIHGEGCILSWIFMGF